MQAARTRLATGTTAGSLFVKGGSRLARTVAAARTNASSVQCARASAGSWASTPLSSSLNFPSKYSLRARGQRLAVSSGSELRAAAHR